MGRFTRKFRQKIKPTPRGAEGPVDANGLEPLLAELKRLLVSSSDIAEPVKFFHDHLANVDVFLSKGVAVRMAQVNDIVQAGVRRIMPAFETRETMTRHLAEPQFWHGAIYGTRGEFAAFFYFDDIRVGAMHLVGCPSTMENHYLRFSGVPIQAPIIPGFVERGQA